MIPQHESNFDYKRLTLKQTKAFMRLMGSRTNSPEEIDELERLLAAASDWTYDEWEELTIGEFEQAVQLLRRKTEVGAAESVPPPNTSSSSTGLAEQPTLSQAG